MHLSVWEKMCALFGKNYIQFEQMVQEIYGENNFMQKKSVNFIWSPSCVNRTSSCVNVQLPYLWDAASSWGEPISECLIRVGDNTCWHAAIYPVGSATMATRTSFTLKMWAIRSIYRGLCMNGRAGSLCTALTWNFCDSHPALSRGHPTCASQHRLIWK